MKRILSTRAPGRHWVGDGFRCKACLATTVPTCHAARFYCFDYAAPTVSIPTLATVVAGLHRGFETVTIVMRGEVEHRTALVRAASLARDGNG